MSETFGLLLSSFLVDKKNEFLVNSINTELSLLKLLNLVAPLIVFTLRIPGLMYCVLAIVLLMFPSTTFVLCGPDCIFPYLPTPA